MTLDKTKTAPGFHLASAGYVWQPATYRSFTSDSEAITWTHERYAETSRPALEDFVERLIAWRRSEAFERAWYADTDAPPNESQEDFALRIALAVARGERTFP